MSSVSPVWWKCPDCGALNSPQKIACGSCGVVIPPEGDDELA